MILNTHKLLTRNVFLISIFILCFISGCAEQRVKETPSAEISPSDKTIKKDGLAHELPVIHFPAGSTRLTNVARKQIREISQLLKRADTIDQSITIDGHSDTLGDAHKNMLLSKKRAESVSRELVINGIRHSRLIIRALGESQPLVSEFNEEGKVDTQASSLNRRVEIFLNKTELSEDQL